MLKRHLYSLITVLLVVLITQCRHDPSDFVFLEEGDPADSLAWPIPPSNTRDTNHIYFKNDILKLIVTKCAPERYYYRFDGRDFFGCHSREDRRSSVILDNYLDIIKEVDIEKSDPSNSDLYTILFDADKPMPVLGSMTQGEMDMIKNWILSGAKKDSCNSCSDYVPGSFIDGVAPILYENCSGCHNSESISDGYVFFDFPYPRDKNDASFQKIKDQSTVILAALRETNNVSMPKYIGRLYECEYNVIKEWVDNGMPNN